MPTSSVGRINKQRGVTLIEMLIVMVIVALIAGLSYPSVSAGLDSLRLRSASNSIVGFLNRSLSRADNRQQVIEILISPGDGTLAAISGDHKFNERLEIPSPLKILSIGPALEASADDQMEARRFLIYPGGAVPKVEIEIGTPQGRKRMVSVDPITGVPTSLVEGKSL